MTAAIAASAAAQSDADRARSEQLIRLPDEDVHAPNEFFRLSSIPLGLRAWVMLLDEVGRMDPAAFHITEPSA